MIFVMKVFSKVRLSGEGHRAAHWITNGSDGEVVRLRPFVKGLAGDLPPSEYYRVGEYWTRSVETVSGRQIVAVAIKYGNLPMTGRTEYWLQ
jgi:hypothetical protein